MMNARWALLAAGVCAGGSALAAPASEQGNGDTQSSAVERAGDDGAFTPLTLGARVGSTAAFALGYGGYDSAHARAIMTAAAEVGVWGPIAIRGGVEYGSTNRARPQVGAHVQLLRQERHGIDGSVAMFYKAEGFTEPEGELETFISLGRMLGSVSLLGNLVYGQDPEGNERDGEVHLAAFYRTRRFGAGLDSRVRFAIGPQHTAHAEPQLDLLVGPSASLALGPIALFAEVGPSVFRIDSQTRVGMAGLAGAGTAF